MTASSPLDDLRRAAADVLERVEDELDPGEAPAWFRQAVVAAAEERRAELLRFVHAWFEPLVAPASTAWGDALANLADGLGEGRAIGLVHSLQLRIELRSSRPDLARVEELFAALNRPDVLPAPLELTELVTEAGRTARELAGSERERLRAAAFQLALVRHQPAAHAQMLLRRLAAELDLDPSQRRALIDAMRSSLETESPRRNVAADALALCELALSLDADRVGEALELASRAVAQEPDRRRRVELRDRLDDLWIRTGDLRGFLEKRHSPLARALHECESKTARDSLDEMRWWAWRSSPGLAIEISRRARARISELEDGDERWTWRELFLAVLQSATEATERHDLALCRSGCQLAHEIAREQRADDVAEDREDADERFHECAEYLNSWLQVDPQRAFPALVELWEDPSELAQAAQAAFRSLLVHPTRASCERAESMVRSGLDVGVVCADPLEIARAWKRIEPHRVRSSLVLARDCAVRAQQLPRDRSIGASQLASGTAELDPDFCRELLVEALHWAGLCNNPGPKRESYESVLRVCGAHHADLARSAREHLEQLT